MKNLKEKSIEIVFEYVNEFEKIYDVETETNDNFNYNLL